MDPSRSPTSRPGAPLAFDRSKFPNLPTRKALVVIDFQNDFVSGEGAVPMAASAGPDAMVERTAELIGAFRAVGDIIWVQSQFERKRNFVEGQQIITKDVAPGSPASPASPARPSRAFQPIDTDAFLSLEGLGCVARRSAGWQMAAPLKKVVDVKRDMLVMKSNYSAFKDTKLLQLLRPKFITTLYLCGSLLNVGVHATAVDAVSHGLCVRLVKDCCGWTKEARASLAMENLIDVSGCDVVVSQNMTEAIRNGTPLDAKPNASSNARPSRPRQDMLKKIEDLAASMGDMGVRDDGKAEDDDDDDDKGSVLEADSHEGSVLEAEEDDTGPGSKRKPSLIDDVNYALRSLSISEKAERPEAKSRELEAKPRDDPQPRPGSTATPRPKNEKETMKSEDDSSASPHTDGARKLSISERGRSPCPKSVVNAAPSGPAEETQTESSTNDKTAPPTETTLPSRQESTISNRGSIMVSETMKSTKAVRDASGGTEQEGAEASDGDVTKVVDNNDNEVGGDTGRKESEKLCEGDTTIIYNLLPKSLEEGAFEKLKTEVDWQRMTHQGGDVPRLVAVQGEVAEDGSMPVYRHPADRSPPLRPFSATVRRLKDEVEKHLGHTLNHVLIQFYRDGKDYISEHSDKTLDIVPETYIANLSLGAERTMVFRTKKPEQDVSSPPPPPTTTTTPPSDPHPPATPPPPPPPRHIQRAKLPHNSLCRMGLKTNMRWLHSIKKDGRRDADRSEPELAFGGARISLTFRHIGTFLSADEKTIWGQGATGKMRAEARQVCEAGDEEMRERMVFAFGRENRASEMKWDEVYGEGFDVVHMKSEEAS